MNTRSFIIEVKKRKPLWDQSNKFYHNKRVLNEKWGEIAKLFDIEVQAAKQKWKNLRDTFRVELKKTNSKNSLWCHFEDMLFLKDLLKTRKLRDLVEPGEAEEVECSSDAIKIEPDMTFSPTRLVETTVENNPSLVIDGIAAAQLQDVDTTNDQFVRGNKRKRSEEEDINAGDNRDDDQDDDLLFFRSLLPFVRKLDQDKKLLFRMNVQQMLYNHLYSNNN